jgi:hypothetical protein
MMLPIHFNENRGLRSRPGERMDALPAPICPSADLLRRQATFLRLRKRQSTSRLLLETKVESMWFLSLVVTIALPRQ